MKRQEISVGAFEAKNKFSELLEKVGRGEEVTITKHDRPVARLVRINSRLKEKRASATADLRALRERYSLEGLSLRALMDEGRR